MASIDEEKRIVKNLSTVMLGKLRANGWKMHWRTLIYSSSFPDKVMPSLQKEEALRFLELLKGEVEELERELLVPAIEIKPAQVMQECADIANMAAMLADIICLESVDPEKR